MVSTKDGIPKHVIAPFYSVSHRQNLRWFGFDIFQMRAKNRHILICVNAFERFTF